VGEHLCQQDSSGTFSKGNSSLWQIWPRVSSVGFLCFFLFLIFFNEEVARVRLHVGGRAKKAACVELCSPHM
jgi:hypothetical protein